MEGKAFRFALHQRIELFFGGEVLFADATHFASKIFGQIFPFYPGFFLVVNPTADIADIFHS